MITQHLPRAQKATYAVLTREEDNQPFFIPVGTGFFLTTDGYFLTALHVITSDNTHSTIEAKRIKIKKPYEPDIAVDCLVREWPEYDLALLKAKSQNSFPFLPIQIETEMEGALVFSFGYPLPKIDFKQSVDSQTFSYYFCPRATSAIISSHFEIQGPVLRQSFPPYYIIDKAVNFGNSGGPLISASSGAAIGVAIRFQPVMIPQTNGQAQIIIPSLYSTAANIRNIADDLSQLGIQAKPIIYL